MPNTKRRKVPEEESSSSDEDMSESIVTSQDNGEIVNVDFEGRSPIVTDKSGISQLLGRLFLKASINTLEMSSLIVAQNYVGSVIHQPESEMEESDAEDVYENDSIFGITTVLNISEKKEEKCIKQLRSYILEQAEKHADKSFLEQLKESLSDDKKQIGYIINERFINIPSPIAIPLFENLQNEITEAIREQKKFNFDHYLMVIKLYRKEAKKSKPSEDFYTNPEEEVISSHAVGSFEFNVTEDCGTGIGGDWEEDDQPLIPYRKVVLLDAKNFPNIVAEIKKVLGNEEN